MNISCTRADVTVTGRVLYSTDEGRMVNTSDPRWPVLWISNDRWHVTELEDP